MIWRLIINKFHASYYDLFKNLSESTTFKVIKIETEHIIILQIQRDNIFNDDLLILGILNFGDPR